MARFHFRMLFKSKDNSVWCHSDNLINWYGPYYNRHTENPYQGISADNACIETLGQYTGLTDKNGNGICEGDILRSDSYPYSDIGARDNYLAVIEWSEYNAAFLVVARKRKGAPVNGVSDGNSEFLEADDMRYFEVIGNIHENDDLLEDEDETV